MNEIIIALIGLSGTIILALLGFIGAKKYNIGPNQEKLVSTLKDVVAAQSTRIEQLEALVATQHKQILELQSDVRELKELTVEQALTIGHLEDELKQARRGGR